MSESEYRCLYAEMLKGKSVTFTVESVRDSPDPLYCQGQESGAWDIIYAERDKEGRKLYLQIPKMNKHGKCTTILRQFALICGSNPSNECAGKRIEHYPVESKKSAVGKAIRLREGKPKQAAK